MLLPPRLRKGGSRSVITSLTTINEEDEEQRSRRKKRRRKESDLILRGDEKKPLSRPDSATSGHNTYIISSSADVQNTGRPELLVLKPDERQRLARERREERDKQNVREAQLFERDERARLYYEKQLEDRRRRLEDQRIKEERKRVAVEEKRRQKLEEEKARYEAVVRRTQEKIQRVRPKQNRWSWGGTLNSGTSYHSDVDRRSLSTMNLSKHIYPVINKRLSSSSATLLSSPDQGLQKQTSLSSSCLVTKVPSKARASREKIHPGRPAAMRRLPLTPWESNVVSRLQTPTHSYLARSRSAVCLYGDAASCHQTSLLSIKTMQPRSAERPIRASLSLERAVKAWPDANQCKRAIQSLPVDRKDKDYVRKSWTNLSCHTPTLTVATTKRAPSPGSQRPKVSQPSSTRSSTKPPQKSPASKRSRTPPPPSSASLSSSNPSLLPGNLRPSQVTPESPRASPEVDQELKAEEEAKREEAESSRGEEEKEEREQSEKKAAAKISTRKAESNAVERVASSPAIRTSVGTTNPEEASRLLAEKRRQAREQREKEEEEKRQQEEAETRHREEMARKMAEERAKREEEAQRLAEEKNRKEEEERLLEEERQQREREEEAGRLQRQKEQEEARQREEAENLRQEREKHFQKEEAERLERKKRLEEIMKRTRRSDQKNPGQTPGNGDVSPQNSQDVVNEVPGIPFITVSAPQTPHDTQHSDSNGHTNPELSLHTLPPAGHEASTEALQENGVVTETPAFEEVIEVPTVTKLSRQEGDGEEGDERRRRTPLLAFRENGSTHDLSEWDQSRVQQHADDV